MSELPAHDIQYPFGLTTDDLIHVGAVAAKSDGLGCADCEGHLNSGGVTVCLACAELREQSEEATDSRMRKIAAALKAAIELMEAIDLQTGSPDRIRFLLLRLTLFAALCDIPETIRRQAATPPGVKA